jgi:beta-galactosidase
MKRTIEKLTTDWLYLPRDLAAAAKVDCDESPFQPVSLPHANVELPYHNFSEQEHCFVSWYRRHFTVPESARGGRVFIDFDGVMIAATVYVNGHAVGPEHRGGYTPFSYDITDHVRFGGGADNVLSVRVVSTERQDIPPFGHVVDYLTFGGIYREVFLRVTPPVYIKHVFARPGNVLGADQKRLDVTARVVNTTANEQRVEVYAILRAPVDAQATAAATAPAGGEADVELAMTDLEAIQLWDLDSPNLYHVEVSIPGGDRSGGDRLAGGIAQHGGDGA